MSDKQQQPFKATTAPGKESPERLLGEEFVTGNGPVGCLDMTLENNNKCREYFLEKLPGSAVHLSAQGVVPPSPDAMGVHQAGPYEPFNHRSGFLLIGWGQV